ncbi:MAG: hypothetical protein AABY68_14020 [Pseudomonadota bacterium]
MAEHFFQERAHQRGQVLWGLLVMLGVLTELALSSLQLAAHEGISVGLLEQKLQQEQRLQVIARQVSQLPTPARSAAVNELWHPASDSVRQGCGQGGRDDEHASYVAISQTCSAPSQPLLAPQRPSGEWQWRLTRITDDPAFAEEGSDIAAFPTLQAQNWQLEVVVAGRGGQAARGLWQRYQQVAP